MKTKKPAKKKIAAILSIAFASLLFLPLSFLGVVTLMASNRSVQVEAKNIENETGLVQQRGRALYDPNGDYLLLRGVNAGNLLVSEGWLSPFSIGESLDESGNVILDHDGLPTYPELPMEQAREGFLKNPNLSDAQRKELLRIYRSSWFGPTDFALIKSMGLNMIRLPFYWRDILSQSQDGTFSRKEEGEAFAYLDSFLEGCKDSGLYCILDLHGAPGGQNGYEHSGDMTKADLWKEERYQKATADLWAYVAGHYTNSRPDLSPVIASYDILNEPCSDYSNPGEGSDPDVCYPVFDQIYQAIRGEGDEHVITIEAMWSYDRFRDPAHYGWRNIMHETHMYNWDHAKIPYWLYNDYHELRNWGHDYAVPFYMGEFTFFEDEAAWKEQLALYERRGYSWSFWNYKASVTGWWTTSWSVVTQKLDLRGGKRKANLATDTYEELRQAFLATSTEHCQKSNTYRFVSEFIQGAREPKKANLLGQSD